MLGDDDIVARKTDSGFAAEVINLLGNELQSVQNEILQLRSSGRFASTADVNSDACIYMMQEENMRLQQELRELAHRRMESKEVAAVRDGLHSPAGRDAPPPKNLDLTEARTNVEHGENIAKLEGKLSANKDKYKQAKSRNAASRKTITETEELLEKIMSERCCASKRLKMAEAELLELEENVRVFSPKDFLSAASPRGSMHTATASEGIIFQIGERLELPWNVNTLCVPGRYISKNHKEIVWADNMKTRCVALSPTHRYDPNAAGGNGGWETPFDMKRHPGEEMDMFYKNERKEWEYVGTYRCVGQTILSCREVESFAMSRMNSAIDRTMVGGPLPTIMQNAVKQMFAMDVLKIACTGWERVSFNQVLARVLRAERHQTADSGQGPESAPPAKRHGQDGETGGKEWKRHKRTRRG